MTGHLMIIGGHEDRHDDMGILRRFVELSGGRSGTIAVITAASRMPEQVWPAYEKAFGELGVRHCHHIGVASREEANDPVRAELLAGAGGICCRPVRATGQARWTARRRRPRWPN